jgi:hypothetical protein
VRRIARFELHAGAADEAPQRPVVSGDAQPPLPVSETAGLLAEAPDHPLAGEDDEAAHQGAEGEPGGAEGGVGCRVGAEPPAIGVLEFGGYPEPGEDERPADEQPQPAEAAALVGEVAVPLLGARLARRSRART